MPGYFDAQWYAMNNRVKRLTIVCGDYAVTVNLADGMKEQVIKLEYAFTGSEIQFVIADVYRGTHYRDTCIAEIKLYNKGEKIEF